MANCSFLNIRAQADSTSRVVDILAKGDKVQIVDEAGPWYKILYKNEYGDAAKAIEYIGKAAALECAYKDAGVTADEVIEKDAEFEKKGGKAWYDVEFETFTTEYDYTIDARTGDVLNGRSEPRD